MLVAAVVQPVDDRRDEPTLRVAQRQVELPRLVLGEPGMKARLRRRQAEAVGADRR